MTTTQLFLLFAFLRLSLAGSVAQQTSIRIKCPPAYFNHVLILGTYRDNGAVRQYQVYDSLRMDRDTVVFPIHEAELPDLFFLSIKGLASSFAVFPEKGSTISLNENDLSKSRVSGSKSHSEWNQYLRSVQSPYDTTLKQSAAGEGRARSASRADSLDYWLKKQQRDRRKWLTDTELFVNKNPESFVSLYLIKTNWQYFKNKGALEKLSTGMSYHKSYNDLLVSLAESRGKTLPQFRITDYNGTVYTNGNFEGKYLVIDFWGTWCQPCIESIPLLREAYLKRRENSRIVFISIANEQKHTDPQKVAKTATKLGIEWVQLIEVLYDPQSLAGKLGVKGFPTLLVVGPDNSIIRESLGDGIPDTLADLDTLLE